MRGIGIMLLLTLVVQYTFAIMFEVQPQVKRCISEDIRRDILVSGNFEISDKLSRNPSFPYDHIMRSFQMEFKIEDPTGVVVYPNPDAKSGTFAFHTEEEGIYQFCFTDNYRSGAPILQIPGRTVTLTISTGVAAKDYAEVAKRENLDPLALELRKIEDNVDKIRDEMMYMKQREEEMRDTNESSNSRVVWLTVFTMVVLITSGVFQILYLRRYFQIKKLI